MEEVGTGLSLTYAGATPVAAGISHRVTTLDHLEAPDDPAFRDSIRSTTAEPLPAWPSLTRGFSKAGIVNPESRNRIRHLFGRF